MPSDVVSGIPVRRSSPGTFATDWRAAPTPLASSFPWVHARDERLVRLPARDLEQPKRQATIPTGTMANGKV